MLCKPVLLALSAALWLSACGTPGGSPSATTMNAQSTTALCTAHGSASGMQLLAIEAELGARGIMQCASSYGTSSYLGEKTSGNVGRSLYSRSAQSATSGDNKDCSDFSSAGEAQRYFLSNGGPHRDPNNLDGDGDGNACEWGKSLKASAKKYKPKPARLSAPVYKPRANYGRTCYTGPRGGRYYYSSSGRKVYGC